MNRHAQIMGWSTRLVRWRLRGAWRRTIRRPHLQDDDPRRTDVALVDKHQSVPCDTATQ